MKQLIASLRAHNKIENGRVARDLVLLQGAKRENILYGSSTDEQRSSSAEDRQPGGLFSGGRLAALLLSHRALAMLLRRALPAARQKTARPFPILLWALTLAAIAACPLAGFAQADLENDTAYLPINKVLDLKTTPPQVDINLPGFLLRDALSGLNTQTTDLQDLVKDVKLIRVLVFEGTKSNRTALDKSMKPLQAELDDKWTTLIHYKDEGDNVRMYTKGDASGESATGLAVLSHDNDDETVIVNVVGRVSLGKLMKVASQSGKLTQDLFKQLGIDGGMSPGYWAGYGGGYGVGYGIGYGETSAVGAAVTSQMRKTDNDAKAKNPLEAPKSTAKGAKTI